MGPASCKKYLGYYFAKTKKYNIWIQKHFRNDLQGKLESVFIYMYVYIRCNAALWEIYGIKYSKVMPLFKRNTHLQYIKIRKFNPIISKFSSW